MEFKEQNLPDRIAELERLWPVMRTKLQQYDKALEEVEKLKAELAIVKKGVACLDGDVAELQTDLKSQGSQHSKRFNDVEASILGVATGAKSIKFVVEQQMTRVGAIEAGVEGLAQDQKQALDALKQMTEQRVTKEVFESHKIETGKKIDQFCELSALGSEVMNSLSRDLSKLSDVRAADSNQIVKVCHILEEEVARNEILESNVKQSTKDLQAQVTKQLQEVKKTLEAQVTALQEANNSSSIQQLKEELLKQMEILKLDCSNASLSGKNNAQKLFLLEKKLEYCTLQLKKLELSK